MAGIRTINIKLWFSIPNIIPPLIKYIISLIFVNCVQIQLAYERRDRHNGERYNFGKQVFLSQYTIRK